VRVLRVVIILLPKQLGRIFLQVRTPLSIGGSG
jgi:hypothetical protein